MTITKNRKKEPILVNAEALLTFSKSKFKKGLRILSKKTVKTYNNFEVSRVRKFTYVGGQTLLNELNKKDQLTMLLTYSHSTTIILRKDFDKLKKKLKKLGFNLTSTEIVELIDGMVDSEVREKHAKSFNTAVNKEINLKDDYTCDECLETGNFNRHGACRNCGSIATDMFDFEYFIKSGKLKKAA